MNKKIFTLVLICIIIFCGCKKQEKNEKILNNEMGEKYEDTIVPTEELAVEVSKQTESNICPTETVLSTDSKQAETEESLSINNKLPDDRDDSSETEETNAKNESEKIEREESEQTEAEATNPVLTGNPEEQTSLPIENILPRDD